MSTSVWPWPRTQGSYQKADYWPYHSNGHVIDEKILPSGTRSSAKGYRKLQHFSNNISGMFYCSEVTLFYLMRLHVLSCDSLKHQLCLIEIFRHSLGRELQEERGFRIKKELGLQCSEPLYFWVAFGTFVDKGDNSLFFPPEKSMQYIFVQ